MMTAVPWHMRVHRNGTVARPSRSRMDGPAWEFSHKPYMDRTMAEYTKLVKELGEPVEGGRFDARGEAEEVATVTFKLPKSTLDRLNKRAQELGVTRSFLIRRGISEILAGGSRSRISKLVLVSTFETLDDNGVPVEHNHVVRSDGDNHRLNRLVSEITEEIDRSLD